MKKLYSITCALFFVSASAFSQCNDLFISEYVEGSGNNKALEIYNPTNEAINPILAPQLSAKPYDYLLKFLLVGDSDVGKQEILSTLENAASDMPFCAGPGT